MSLNAHALRLVIIGATGMVGGYALHYALRHPDIASVTVVVRRSLGFQHPKLQEVIHTDFSDCSDLSDVLEKCDAAVFCLGAYTGTVPDAELRKITVDYTVEFARVLHASNPQAKFAFLSGMGADQTGKSRVAFARYKGEAEKALIETGFPYVEIFRPAYIYPVEPRNEPNIGYRLLRYVYPVFRRLFPAQVIRADALGYAMVEAVLQDHGMLKHRVLENRDIQIRAKNLTLP